jgi:hypothetical protein
MTLIIVLAIANIPVYLFLGWLAFDTKSKAGDTFADTLVAILKIMFIPRIVRVLMGDDDDDAAWGIFPLLGFFAACAGIVYGQYYLIQKFWHRS